LLSSYGGKLSRDPEIDQFDLASGPAYCNSNIADVGDSAKTDDTESKLLLTGLLLEWQDFSGNSVLPSFGVARPDSDFFYSQLHLNAFVIESPSTNMHEVICYDERCGGKGVNELCSNEILIVDWDINCC
jgi:hypothetical protein